MHCNSPDATDYDILPIKIPPLCLKFVFVGKSEKPILRAFTDRHGKSGKGDFPCHRLNITLCVNNIFKLL
jgi:hypothetical protein